MELLTPRQCALIINNVVKACDDIEKLNKTGYNFIHNCSHFIAHYSLWGFIDFYTKFPLRDDILDYKRYNQWSNFSPADSNYDYYMQKRQIYNQICNRIYK